MSAAPRARRPPGPEPTTAPAPAASPEAAKKTVRPPFLLDFFPLESEQDTRLARFFERLREGRLTTTRCPHEGSIHWPPRVACPTCHREALEWIDLPEEGRIYAFSAVLGGAPLGMEDDVPFAVGLVDLTGAPIRLFGRIEGRPWTGLAIGDRVRAEPYEVGDGRVFYRFRTVD